MFVPGRLEVLGKHTDYAGGRSLLAAVERGITINLADGSRGIRAGSTALPDPVTIHPGQESHLPVGHWGSYLQTVADRLALNFGELRPATIEIASDLPLASGMSSSSALVVAAALALIRHNGFDQTDLWRANIRSQTDLADYMGSIENGTTFGTLEGRQGVGTFGGSEDHTAMLCCQAGHLTQFSFCPVTELGSVQFSPQWSFIVAVSGVLAEKTGSALESYNRAAARARQVVKLWNATTGRSDATIADALDSADDAATRLTAIVSEAPELAARLRAFLVESQDLIPAAFEAVATADLARLGNIADRSQRSAEDDLRNQVPQTTRLQRLARELGAGAAVAFGAGFGGSVWAITKTDEAAAFATEWLERYLREFPETAGRATTLITRPGVSAREL